MYDDPSRKIRGSGSPALTNFSDVPKFPAQLKPISPRIVPTQTVDQFVKAMAQARDEADKAVKP